MQTPNVLQMLWVTMKNQWIWPPQTVRPKIEKNSFLHNTMLQRPCCVGSLLASTSCCCVVWKGILLYLGKCPPGGYVQGGVSHHLLPIAADGHGAVLRTIKNYSGRQIILVG